MLRTWMERLPAWIVGLVGATLAILSTVLSAIFSAHLDQSIGTYESTIRSLESEVRLLGENHIRGDERAATAEIFIALHLSSREVAEYALHRAGYHIRGSLMAMSAAASVPDDNSDETKESVARIRRGDPSGMEFFSNRLDTLRLKSAEEINRRSALIAELHDRVSALDVWNRRIQNLAILLNLIALSILLAKDLPVWKRQS